MVIKYVVLSDKGERLQDVLDGWDKFNAKDGQLVSLSEAESISRQKAVELYGLYPAVTSDAPAVEIDKMTQVIGEVKTEIENLTFIIYLGVTPLPASQIEANAKSAAQDHVAAFKSNHEINQLMRDTATLVGAKKLKADEVVRAAGKTAGQVCDDFYAALQAQGDAVAAMIEFEASEDKIAALATLKAALPL